MYLLLLYFFFVLSQIEYETNENALTLISFKDILQRCLHVVYSDVNE